MKRTYSHTKRSVLEKCPRQFFFAYYATGVVQQPSSAQKRLFADLQPARATIDRRTSEEAGRLKHLSNCYHSAGQILHRLVAQYLKGRARDRADWLRTAESQFAAAVRRSSSSSLRDGGSLARPAGTLLEFYYDQPDANQTAETVQARLVQAMACFLDHVGIRELVRVMLQGPDVLIEQRIGGLPKIDNYSIQGQVDFASRAAPGVRIVDWKMGSSAGDDDSGDGRA